MTTGATAKAPRTDFRFGTKAQTLCDLAGRLQSALLCDQMIITSTDWARDADDTTAKILERFDGRDLVVRSSADAEDRAEISNAGAFDSVTDVSCDAASIGRAIDKVIASYGADSDGQELLIQEMVRNVALSGVVLTRDLDTGGPYYAINYDDFSGRTDTVTGGAESKTVLVRRGNPGALHSPRMQAIIAAAIELESICGREELDIEFCMTHAVELYILQVRPLAAQRRWKNLSDDDIDEVTVGIRAAIAGRMEPVNGLSGRTTIFGEMPDWNPAEMIGTSPRPLAESLYRHLITDRTWSEARARMGYRPVDRPLMIDFAGRPYIDTRLSFNSLLPAKLDNNLADRLVDHQLAGLSARPDLHDKIEFELAVTCIDLNHEARMHQLRQDGFSLDDTEILTLSLHELTSNAIVPGGDGVRNLLSITAPLLSMDPTETAAPLDRVKRLLEVTREKGTLPFSMLARHAFIGVTLLKSMTARGVLSDDDADRFMRSVHTVAAELVIDMAALAKGDLAQQAFLAKYGHLRPGTYDILSSRYDERPDIYLGHDARTPLEEVTFEASSKQVVLLESLLAEHRLDISATALFDYIAAAIAAREQAKFAFTRGISDALSALVEWGDSHNLTRDDLSFIRIEDLLGADTDLNELRDAAQERRNGYSLSRAIYLPHLIVEPDDIDVIRLLRGQATYITGETVTARAVQVDAQHAPKLDGRIVLIESADPGYDWIFSHRIAALVTKFGGANSHMAIRCAEFGLPAAIGCGEKTYGDLKHAAAIELNCAARTIRAVGQSH